MMKKIFALVLAVVMVLAMGATAFASEDMTGESGVIGEFTSADQPDTPAKQNSVLLDKEIVVYNKDSAKVWAPKVDYTYTIASGNPDKDIYDVKTAHDPQTNVHASTKAGPAGAKIYGSVDGGTTFVEGKLAFTNAVEFNASASGASNKYDLKVDLSGVTFPDVGVYRYVITETITANAKNLAGIADGTVSDVRYLDVYVKRGETAGTYEIYGYVCFAYNNNIDARDADTAVAADAVDKAYKTEGFVAGTNSNTHTAETADAYYTFDLTISKTLEGDAAMNGHQFPFNVDFTNDSVTAEILLKQTTVSGGGITANLPAAAGVNSLDVADLKLANGASVTYVGIPVGITAATTVAVCETNDVAGTTYESKYKIDSAAEFSGVKNIAGTTDVSETATLSTISANAHDTASTHTIAFTNVLKLISPTGVALRIAPYVGMLVAGIALIVVVVVKRRKNEEEAEA